MNRLNSFLKRAGLTNTAVPYELREEYIKTGRKYSIKELQFYLTDQPQQWNQFASGTEVVSSLDSTYQNEKLILKIYISPKAKEIYDSEGLTKLFHNMAAKAIFDVIYNPRNTPFRNKQAIVAMKVATENNKYIFQILDK